MAYVTAGLVTMVLLFVALYCVAIILYLIYKLLAEVEG